MSLGDGGPSAILTVWPLCRGVPSLEVRSPDLAIVHITFRSTSTAPPAVVRVKSFSDKKRERKVLSLLESGNLPDFAQGDPIVFWRAADTHERVNGRVYTELQVALPRELSQQHCRDLAKRFTGELLGSSFTHTLAVHTSELDDGSEQSDMHLLFSERAVNEQTRLLESKLFFKRNGARKDHSWNARAKPQEVRVLWVKILNEALEEAGSAVRVDARSWADQGRYDLSSLREPKLLTEKGPATPEARAQVHRLRQRRDKLPSMQLDQTAAFQVLMDEERLAIREVRLRRDRQLAALERTIKNLKPVGTG